MLKRDKKSIIYIIIMVLLGISLICHNIISEGIQNLLLTQNVIYDNDSFRMHFVDVGQGDAIAINLPDGKTMLIDTGTAYSITDLTDYLDANVLYGNGGVIDYLLLTHSDADHTGGASAVLSRYEVKTIFRSKIYSSIEDPIEGGILASTTTFENTINSIYAEPNAEVIFWDDVTVIQADDYTITIYDPPLYNRYGVEYTPTDANEFSPFILIECGGISYMLSGDADEVNELAMIRDYYDICDVDILKLGHHGSSSSTCDEWLLATTPDEVVISVGNNSYGHPSADVMTRLYDYGLSNDEIHTTLSMGDIVYLNGDGYEYGYIYGDMLTVFDMGGSNFVILITVIIVIDGYLLVKRRKKRKK